MRVDRFSTPLDHKRHSSGVPTETVTIGRRYRGPLDSANGGYAAGLLVRIGDAAEVTLRLPPPLERPLTIRRDGDRLLLEHEGRLVAEAVPGDPGLTPPARRPPRRPRPLRSSSAAPRRSSSASSASVTTARGSASTQSGSRSQRSSRPPRSPARRRRRSSGP